jgi:hypothetical protein
MTDLFQVPDPGLPPSAATGEPGSGLGKNADFVGMTYLPAPGTVRGWHLRSHARDVLMRAGVHKRLRWCGTKVARGARAIGVHARPDRAYGRVSGVCVCGQSLCCPVCAPRIAAFRAADVARGFANAAARGWEARLVTYTMPHTVTDGLGSLLDMMSLAWRRMQTNRGRDLRAGSHGNVTAQEINWSAANGWHPHKHQLRFDEPGRFDEHRHRAAWLASLETVGRLSRGAQEHAFDVGMVGSEAGARYVSKLALAVDAQARASAGMSMELAGGANKGRNMIALLADAALGDVEAEAVWLRGVSEVISRKVSSLRWSRGLRAELDVPAEKSDEEIAAEEVTPLDVFLGVIHHWQWRVVVAHRAELALCCAANRGREAVDSFLSGLGAGHLYDEEPDGPPTPRPYIEPEKLSDVDRVCAEIQREIDRPSGLSRKQLEAFKESIPC